MASSTTRKHYLLQEKTRLEDSIQKLKKAVRDGNKRAKPEATPQVIQELLRASEAATSVSDTHWTSKEAGSAVDGVGSAVTPMYLAKQTSDPGLADLQTLASITGIVFETAESSAIQDDAGSRLALRKYKIKGSCHGLSFMMLMVASDSEATVRSMSIDVDQQCKVELGSFCAAVEASKSPHAFFRGFVQFAEINVKRASTLKRLQTAHPAAVQLPYGSACSWFLHMKSRFSGGFSFNFSWNISPTPEGRVSPTIKMTPIVGGGAKCAPGDAKLFAQLPDRFDALCRLRGLEGALFIMAEMVAGVPLVKND